MIAVIYGNVLQDAVCRDGGPQKNAFCHEADFTLASAMTMLYYRCQSGNVLHRRHLS